MNDVRRDGSKVPAQPRRRANRSRPVPVKCMYGQLAVGSSPPRRRIRGEELHLLASARESGRQPQHRLARPPVAGLEARNNMAGLHVGVVLGFNTRHGFPAQTVWEGTSFTTTERAPTTLSAPIVTPGPT